MVKVTLDADTFKALASATRLTVLRALDDRRKTLTELAKDLGLNKATVHEHLQLLTSAGLVRKRDDEGRKWIYYELTWRGEKILHPQETTTFNVLLGLSTAAAGGSLALMGRALGWWWQPRREAGDGGADEGAAGPASDTSMTAEELRQGDSIPEEPTATGDGGGLDFFSDGGWVSIALVLTCVLFLVLAFLVRRRLDAAPLAKTPGTEDDGSLPGTGPG